MLSRLMVSTFVALALLACAAFAQIETPFASIEAFDDTYNEEYDSLSSMLSEQLTLSELKFEPLDLSQELDREAYEALTNDKDFIEFRNQKYLTSHGLTAAQYDAAFIGARNELLNMASSVGLEVDLQFQSYEEVLESIATTTGLQSNVLQSEQFVSLYTNSILFDGAKNLSDPIEADIELGANAVIGRFVKWLVRVINNRKCGWCKGIAGYIRKKLCGLAGSAMCNLAATAFGVLKPVVVKWGCGSPLNISGIFGHWCNVGVQFIQRKTGWTDHKICSFSIPRFSVAGNSVNIGRIC